MLLLRRLGQFFFFLSILALELNQTFECTILIENSKFIANINKDRRFLI